MTLRANIDWHRSRFANSYMPKGICWQSARTQPTRRCGKKSTAWYRKPKSATDAHDAWIDERLSQQAHDCTHWSGSWRAMSALRQKRTLSLLAAFAIRGVQTQLPSAGENCVFKLPPNLRISLNILPFSAITYLTEHLNLQPVGP